MNFLSLLIAKRLYLSQKKNKKILIISNLSRIGIFFSVLVLIISFSALNGFNILLDKTFISKFPHGIIEFPNPSLLKWKKTVKKLNSVPGITYSEPYIIINGILSKKEIIKVIEIKSFENIKNLEKKISILHKKSNFLKKKILTVLLFLHI